MFPVRPVDTKSAVQLCSPTARKRDQRSPVGIGISVIDRGLSLVPLANLGWLHAPILTSGTPVVC